MKRRTMHVIGNFSLLFLLYLLAIACNLKFALTGNLAFQLYSIQLVMVSIGYKFGRLAGFGFLTSSFWTVVFLFLLTEQNLSHFLLKDGLLVGALSSGGFAMRAHSVPP